MHRPALVRLRQAGVVALYAAMLALPAYAFFHDRAGTAFLHGAHDATVLQLLFPLVGLYAFTFVTAQVLITTNLHWLTRLWPRVIIYHRAQGIFTLLFAITHPAFILAGYGLTVFLGSEFVQPGRARWLIPSYTALTILIVTVGTALLAWSGRRLPWWRAVHRLNYLAFALIWIHSWFIGTDTPTRLLRITWLIYLSAVLASAAGRFFAARRETRLPTPRTARNASHESAPGLAP